jgi:hypothetical protein
MSLLKFNILTITVFMSLQAFGQTYFRNDGKINVTNGSDLVIQGSYQNEGTGSITLDGILKLTGDWTNNAADSVIDNPGTNGEVIFAGTTTQTLGGSSSYPFTFEKLTINSAAIVEVTAGKPVTAYGACAFTSPLVLKTTTGTRPLTATYINKSTVTGNITSEMYYYSTGTSAKTGGRTWYFAAPTTNATAAVFNVAGGLNLMSWYNAATGAYARVTTNATSLPPMRGYELRSATSNTFSFTGPPNTGSFSQSSMTGLGGQDGFYLMGNPYPCVLDWSQISTTNLYSTMWYRTMNGSNIMVYDTWNGVVGTSANGTATVDGKIPPMQSFWVCVMGGQTGSISFDNTARTHNWGSAPFIKSAKINTFDAIRIAIFGNGSKDEQIIMQIGNAKDSMDRWDAFKLFVNNPSVAEIYTLSSERKKLVIQAVAPITDEKSFPLALKIGQAGNYKFAVNINDYRPALKYFLEDKQQGTMQDLGENTEYNFTSDVVNDTSGNRFVIHIKTIHIPDVPDVPDVPNIPSDNSQTEINQTLIYSSGQQIFIKNCPIGSGILMYDALGRLVYESKAETDFKVISVNLQNGYYMIRVIDKNKIISRIVPISL